MRDIGLNSDRLKLLNKRSRGNDQSDRDYKRSGCTEHHGSSTVVAVQAREQKEGTADGGEGIHQRDAADEEADVVSQANEAATRWLQPHFDRVSEHRLRG